MNRIACRAGSFYPSSHSESRKLIEECGQKADALPSPGLPENPVAGIIPHAGWVFSGPTAMKTLLSFRENPPNTFVLLGAVHFPGVGKPTLFPDGQWETPLGPVEVDGTLTKGIAEALQGDVQTKASAHEMEHSIEVQLPLLKFLYPEAKMVAMACPPLPDIHHTGAALGSFLLKENKKVVVLGSTDLTHYGAANFAFAPKGSGPEALQWVKESNDQSMIDRILTMDAAEIVTEAAANHNACGAGAIAATVGCAKAMGKASGTLVHYTTSHDVMPHGSPSDFVGYAGIVF